MICHEGVRRGAIDAQRMRHSRAKPDGTEIMKPTWLSAN